MSIKLNALNDKMDQVQLREFVQDASTEELTKMVCEKICDSSISKLLDDILQICSEFENLYSKRLKIIESSLKALGKAKVRINHANDIVNRIVVDFPNYPKVHLIKLVEFCLASIRNNDDDFRSWKDMLPVLLEVLEEKKCINYMNGEVSGSKYKSLIVNNICNSEWNIEIMPSLARMFRDMALEKDDHTVVITILCTKLQNIPPAEIPPFVHQLLRLCNNQESKYLLEALRRYFTSRTSEIYSEVNISETIGNVTTNEFHDIESTVLYHIYQAAQLNHQHIKDYTRYFKNVSCAPEAVLQPFLLSLLLTISSVCENQIFIMLRTVINKRNEIDNKRIDSAWLRKLIPDSCGIITIIENVIHASNRNRHLVLKGLVDLAFILMATECRSKTDIHPSWEIGIKILKKIMKIHHETIGTVLQTLIDKMIVDRLHIFQYADCLKFVCRRFGILVLEHEDYILTFLDQISSIPGEINIFIFIAMFPLMYVSVNVREHIILTLRKILYRKGTRNRQVAVSGILEILKSFKIHSLSGLAMNSSQCTNPVSSTTGESSTSVLTQVILERNSQGSIPVYTKTLCYDMLGILRKCFTHECEVRLHLYNGLYDVVMKNTEITEYVLEMLLPHLKMYFEADENVLIPVKLELCMTTQGDQIVLQEPLADLIYVLQKISIKSASMRLFLIDEIIIILESLCKRMPRINLENLNLNDKFDLNNTSTKSQEKLQNLILIIKIYEALISFKIGSWSIHSKDTAQDVKSLFKGYTRLVEFTKQIPKAKKGESNNKKQNDTNSIKKPGRPNNIKLPHSIVDLSIVCKCLSLYYLRTVPWAIADEIALLIEHDEFYYYILRTLLQILQNVKLLTKYDLRKDQEQYMKKYFEIGKLLYNHIILELKNALNRDEQGTILALECFKELCCLMCTCFESELAQFLDIIISNEERQSVHLNEQLENIISALRSSFKIFFIEKEEYLENSRKILCVLLDIIYQFIRKINFREVEDDKVFNSMMKFTQLEDMDSQASLIIFQVLLWIEERSKEYGELLIDLAVALCEKVGGIDKDEMSANNKFKIVHEATAVQLYNLINNSVKEKLDNVSWLLVHLKAKQNIACPFGTDLEALQETLRTEERSLCRQLSHIIQILYTLANVSIKPGQTTDFMFKNLQCLYNILSNLTRYFYGKSNKQNAAFQSVKFIQVIQSAGKSLKPAFYNLITYTEENQNLATSKTDSHIQRNKILKETKIIPRVVYEIEQFHKEILLLDKKTGVPLESYIKHSITRDFRIKNTQLAEALEKMDISLLDTQNSRGNNDISNVSIHNISTELSTVSPPAKRSKTTSKD